MLKYRRFTLLLLSCAAALPFPVGMAAEFPSAGQLQGLGLQLHWEGQAVLNTSRDEVRYRTIDEDVVVVQSTAGVVSVFNAEDGRRRWAAQIGRTDEAAQPAVTNDRLVLVIAGPVLYGLDKFTGDEVIQHRLPSSASAGCGVGTIERDDTRYEYAYVPMAEGSVYCYDLQTLRHLHRYGTLPPQVSRPFLWRFICKEQIDFPPVFAEEATAFATRTGNLHVINSAGETQYQFLMDEPATAPLTVIRDADTSSLIMATGKNLLYDIMLEKAAATKITAQVDWTLPLARPVNEQPIAVGNSVYVVSESGGLHNIARDTGRPVRVSGDDGRTDDWFIADIAAVTAVSRSHVYAIDRTNRLLAINRTTAKVSDRDDRLLVASYQRHYSNAVTDRLYLLSSSGQVVCLRETGSEFATYHQNPSRQPIDVNVSDPQEEATEEPPADADPSF